ncbi:MAG TPA: polyribonucleotide nucleotidyltransferase [Chloroflexaceae bacterium]|nr:polyribonucleotide nucleotidyltransferase [Chloroflexaceae bacterium]
MTERQVYSVSAEIAGRTLTLEAGRFAEQADGAVTVRYGDTVLLATVVGAHEPREGIDFFPLTIDYEERMYSAGKIPGNFFKREGRPTTTAILTARLTDRPLRPLFPKGYQNEVQVIITTFSIDMVNDPGPLAIIGASAALAISDIPFKGPVGAVQMGHLDGGLVVNPPMADMERSRLDLVVAGTREAVLMVEAGAFELTEEEMLQAVMEGHAVCQQLCDLQDELVRLCGKPKREFVPPAADTSLEETVRGWIGARMREAVRSPVKQERDRDTQALKDEAIAHFTADEPEEELPARRKEVAKVFERMLKDEVRDAILDEGIRVDGRAPEEIRSISVDVGVIPRVHGSGLFTRGQTQVLTITTLGSPGDEQRLDDLGLETTKRYIHHYNFPPYSTGEARRIGSPRRRDIGHGALAERSLVAVLPPQSEFPYTLRLVSEVLSSNGSSSMASVCGSSLSMMDAGVPLKAPVAGVAMGLITDPDGRWKVLTDIQGLEDALGDMDFKVAGTAGGITGLQMDIKTTGITFEIMREAFEQARQGRLHILEKMNAVISQGREEMSPHAPRILTLQIPVEKIGALIGPGGKNIRGIVDTTGAQVDVEDDGRVFVTTADGEAAKAAVAMIEGLTREAKVGDIFLGKVVSIKPFGAFVNILPGKDGMVHVSELAETRVENVEDVVQLGDEINVMVIGVDQSTGKISLSRRAVLTGESPEERRAAGGGGASRDRGPRGDRGDRGDRGGPPRNGGDRPRPRRREDDR